MSFPKEQVLNPVIGFIEYDEAMQKFLTIDVHQDPRDNTSPSFYVKPVVRPPRREYGTQEFLNPDAQPESFDEDPQKTANQRIAVPTMSLTRFDWRLDRSRWNPNPFRKLGYTDDGNRIIQSEYPTPVNVPYQLDLWSKFQVVMNQMVRKIINKMARREVALDVDLGGPWGVKPILLYWQDGPRDLTVLDPDEEDRSFRMTFTLVLQAWILSDPYTVPTVRSISVQPLVPNKGTTTFPDNGSTDGWTSDGIIKVADSSDFKP